MYTELTYQYRDTSNYKTANRVTFAGQITDEQQARFRDNLMGLDFYPEQVGLETASFGGQYEDDDDSMNEFCYFRIVASPNAALDDRTIDQFIDEFAAHAWTDPHEFDPIGDFANVVNEDGVRFIPWTDGSAVGYKVIAPDGRETYLYLNPSLGSDDGVVNVFLYEGHAGDGMPVTSVDLFDGTSYSAT